MKIFRLTFLARYLRNFVLGLLIVLTLAALLLWRVWQIRGSIEETGWPESPVITDAGDSVTATWLGVTTVLFDDGETQLLVDGVFTRVHPVRALLLQKVSSDIATINYAMSTFRMNRLAAVLPTHAHFDHALDTGAIANRTSAVVLGSESAANIVRGADLPVAQYQILADGESRQFGEFTVTLLASIHAPVGLNGNEVFPGIIDHALTQPARISDYRTGVAWSVLIGHPKGTTLVQSSAGYVPGRLHTSKADVVMLGVAGLARLGRDYTRKFWYETVTATDAARVIAIHHDDFTAPFGEVRLLPTLLDNVPKSARWINELLATGNGVAIEIPPFGQPIVLY